MITAEEILEALPKLLKEKPILKRQLYSILSEEYVTKDDILEYMKKSDEQWNMRFEKEKEEWDKKFEAEKEEWDKKFEAEKKELKEWKDESNKRFDAIDKRFDAIDKQFESIDKRFESIEREIVEIKSVLGTMGRRTGQKQEDLILAIFKKELEWRNIDVNQIKHLVITDDAGELFEVKNSPVEIDMYLHNGLHILFEIKHFFSDKEDVYYFHRKANFVDKKLGINSKRVIITVDILEKIYSLAESLGMEIITGEKTSEIE